MNDVTYFSFSIPNQPAGVAEVSLSQLLQKMEQAQIRLQGISGFASGPRIKIFCIPKDADQFRDFLRSAGFAPGSEQESPLAVNATWHG